ncbi:HlyD family type I secretion periplasmic adaptor subunit [Camelimonas sp. ID_303_24]
MNAQNFDSQQFKRPASGAIRGKRGDLSLGAHVIAGVTLTMLLVAGFGGWAISANLNGAVVGQGAVKVDQNLKEVQHRDGGIIRSIAIRQGDQVSEGQVLFRLDDVQTRAELSIIRAQLAENLARGARLAAERDGLASITYPPGLAAYTVEAPDIMKGETRLFNGNRTNRESRKEQLEIAIVQLGEEAKGLGSRRVAKTEELRLVELERNKFLGLFSKGYIDGSRVFNINREWTRLLGEQGEIESALARARLRISETRLQIIAIDDGARTEAQRELRQVEARLAELHERRVANEDRLSRTDIRAPIAGTVNEMTVFTVGGVVSPAARLATVVPLGAKLMIEVRIAPTDIDQVRPGQMARLRFPAFDRNTTPEIPGKVSHVSPATTRDPATGQSYYVAEIQLNGEPPSLRDRKLVPGMPVEVMITTEERTALSYLAKPFLDHVSRAFTER